MLQEIDYRLAFEHAPVGMVVSRNRAIVACNAQLCEMFGAQADQLVGQSFSMLYPSVAEFERIGKRMEPFLNASGHYADNRMMKRVDGPRRDETFWCHVNGRALDRAAPHAAGIWTFEDLGARKLAGKDELTPREREVAAQVMRGLTSKEIGKALAISHRTVEIHRARLMRKYAAATTAELVQKLISG
jgi:PAS domain S-box-containing protein